MSASRGGELEQLRPQSTASMLQSSEVDLKADSLAFQEKLDHPASLGELRHVTHCQDSLFVQGFNGCVKSGVLGGAQEKNLAIARLLWSGDSLSGYSLSSYRFTCKSRIKNRAKRILPENTEREGVVLGKHHVPRPFDEVAEVVKIGGLHVVVSGL